MNQESFISAFQQQGDFNTYLNTSYNQHAMVTSNGTECEHQGVPESHTQPPGTHHPGINQYYARHPGANPLLTQHRPIHYSGANQYTAQYLGTSHYATFHPGQWQFGDSQQHTGAESRLLRNPPFTGRTPQCSRNKKPLISETARLRVRPKFPSPCPQTRFIKEKQYTDGKARHPVDNNGTWTAVQYNFQFDGSMSSSAPNQAFNEFQLSGLKTNPVSDNSPFWNESDSEREVYKEQTTEDGQSSELQRRQMEKDRIANLIRIQHLILTYVKVRNLVVLCRDFKTPVFGDFPDGNEVEKKILESLSQYLKEEIKKIRFIDLEEGEEPMSDEWVEDPILRANFSVLRATITRFEIRRNDLQDEREKNENLEKEIKAFSEELSVKEREAKSLKAELQAEKNRWKKLSDRLKAERKNNEATRLQFAQEMEAINQVKIYKLHEDLRALQEKISKETKTSNEKKQEIQIVMEENNSLRLRIGELDGSLDLNLMET